MMMVDDRLLKIAKELDLWEPAIFESLIEELEKDMTEESSAILNIFRNVESTFGGCE